MNVLILIICIMNDLFLNQEEREKLAGFRALCKTDRDLTAFSEPPPPGVRGPPTWLPPTDDDSDNYTQASEWTDWTNQPPADFTEDEITEYFFRRYGVTPSAPDEEYDEETVYSDEQTVYTAWDGTGAYDEQSWTSGSTIYPTYPWGEGSVNTDNSSVVTEMYTQFPDTPCKISDKIVFCPNPPCEISENVVPCPVPCQPQTPSVATETPTPAPDPLVCTTTEKGTIQCSKKSSLIDAAKKEFGQRWYHLAPVQPYDYHFTVKPSYYDNCTKTPDGVIHCTPHLSSTESQAGGSFSSPFSIHLPPNIREIPSVVPPYYMTPPKVDKQPFSPWAPQPRIFPHYGLTDEMLENIGVPDLSRPPPPMEVDCECPFEALLEKFVNEYNDDNRRFQTGDSMSDTSSMSFKTRMNCSKTIDGMDCTVGGESMKCSVKSGDMRMECESSDGSSKKVIWTPNPSTTHSQTFMLPENQIPQPYYMTPPLYPETNSFLWTPTTAEMREMQRMSNIGACPLPPQTTPQVPRDINCPVCPEMTPLSCPPCGTCPTCPDDMTVDGDPKLTDQFPDTEPPRVVVGFAPKPPTNPGDIPPDISPGPPDDPPDITPPPPGPPTSTQCPSFHPDYTAVPGGKSQAEMVRYITAENNKTGSRHDPDGITWIPRANWIPWDGVTTVNPCSNSKQQIQAFIFPKGPDAMRGLREHFYNIKPYADNSNPTVSEIENWNVEVIRHFRKLLGVTTPVSNDKCTYLRAAWSEERARTTYWSVKYPGAQNSANGPCDIPYSRNAHCGDGFIPAANDQTGYLCPSTMAPCTSTSGAGGISTHKTHIPWSTRVSRIIGTYLASDGIDGHTGPFVNREFFGSSWYIDPPAPGTVVVRTKWSGKLTPMCP